MWINLIEALFAVLAFVVVPFLVIASMAWVLESLDRLFHFLLQRHKHQH